MIMVEDGGSRGRLSIQKGPDDGLTGYFNAAR
jgi:hypothetical protein